MSFDFQGSQLTEGEKRAYQKTFKTKKGKRGQRNKLPPSSNDAPEAHNPPANGDHPGDHKVLQTTYSFVKNSYSLVKGVHPLTTKLGSLLEGVSNKVLGVTSKINEKLPGDLKAVDELVAPVLSTTINVPSRAKV